MAYTNIDDPSAHFQAYAWTKSSGTGSITNDGNSDLQPDIVWAKSSSNADSHELWDTTRGVNNTIFPDNTQAQDTAANRIVSFDTDGFTWGNAGNLNAAGDFVAWQFKVNGGSTSSNSDGTITTTLQANTDAGISICRHDGNGTAGATFGHGLGVKPRFIISKRLDSITNWRCYHYTETATKTILLNTTGGSFTSSDSWNNTEPTTSVVTVGNSSRTNASGSPILFYNFAQVQGFSKFGTYHGTGKTNGPFIYCGFQPAFIITKYRSSSGSWYMADNKRDGYNPDNRTLQANDTAVEQNTDRYRIYSNGFQIVTTETAINQLNGGYEYWAFAKHPFVTSTGVPCNGGI